MSNIVVLKRLHSMWLFFGKYCPLIQNHWFIHSFKSFYWVFNVPAFALGVGVDDQPKGKKKKATPCPCGFYNLVERDQNHA